MGLVGGRFAGGTGGGAYFAKINHHGGPSIVRGGSQFVGGSGVVIGTGQSASRDAMGSWSGRDPWTREIERVPGLRERVGTQSRSDRGAYSLQRSLFSGFAAIAARPQLWINGGPNFERNPQIPNTMLVNDEKTRPQSLVMRAWGMQASGDADWAYVEKPMDSRARGGTVSGGFMFSLPRFEAEDFFGIGETYDVEDTAEHTTDGFVLITPGVSLAFGTPVLTGASPVDANAVQMYRDTAANNYAWRLDVAGVPALRAYQSGGTPAVEAWNGSSWGSIGGGGGVSDHGALTGLPDDDHPQYHNDSRGDARYYTKAAIDARVLNDIDDVDTTGVSNGDYLGYNSGSSTWEPITPPVLTTSDISDYVAPKTYVVAEEAASTLSPGTAGGKQWSFGSSVSSGAAGNEGIVILESCTVSALGIHVFGGVAGGNDVTIEIYKNGSATGDTLTITGAASTAHSTSGFSASFAAGDRLNILTVGSTGTTSGPARVSVLLESS